MEGFLRSLIILILAGGFPFRMIPLSAQEPFVLSGRISAFDTGKPLAGVYVTAFCDHVSVGAVYTGEDGCFLLKCRIRPTELSATFLGYKVHYQDLSAMENPLDIRLSPTEIEIGPAAIQARVVEERGDTLSYQAQAFLDGSERVLGELLEKLPGITINPTTGAIYHNSRPINKFYVEGLDLMGSRYGVVTQNLSSDKIDRVEVLRQHQPVQALQGIELSGDSAINIILKKDERDVWTLGAYAAAGAPPIPLFSASAMLTRFAQMSQDLFLLKGNNIGQDILRELQAQQYFGKARSFVVDTRNADADFATELHPSRTALPLPQRFWYDNLSGLASLNHLTKTGEDRQFRVSLNGAAERFRETSLTREVVHLDGTESLSIEEQRSLLDRQFFGSLSACAERNSAHQFFSNEFTAAGQLRDARSSLSRKDPYAQQYGLPAFKLQNQLQMTIRLRGDRAFSFSSDTRFVRNTHQAAFTTAAYQASQDLAQSVFSSENTADLDFRTGKLRWKGAAGIDLAYNSTHTRLSGLSGQGFPGTQQDFRVFSVCPHLSLRSNFNLGASQWTATLPVRLSLIFAQARFLAAPEFSPSLSVALRFSQSWDFSASATFSQSHSAPESLAEAYIMQDWRTLARRDSLRRTTRLSARAQLRYSDNAGLFFATLTGSYTRFSTNRASAYDYSPLLTIRTFLPVTLGSENYSATGRLSKYFGARMFVANLSCTGTWSGRDEFLQNRAVHYLDFSLSTEITLNFNPVSWLAANAKGTHILTDIRGEAPVKYQTLILEGDLTVRPVRQLSLRLQGYGLWQQVPGQQISNIPLLDASAGWKFGRYELVLECRNLLDVREFSRESTSAWRSIATVSQLRGRQFMLSLRAAL